MNKNEVKTKTEIIKELYEQLDKKGVFKSEIAKKLGKSVKYLTNYWFPNCDGITLSHQDFVLKELEDTIANQKAAKIKVVSPETVIP